jgi:hypothetical protein
MLRRIDYWNHPFVSDDAFRDAVLGSAVNSASSVLSQGLSIEHSKAGRRDLYQIRTVPDQLIVRKLAQNIKRLIRSRQWSRNSIIKNLIALLSEGVHYRIYRLDIRHFYGSFIPDDILAQIRSHTALSPQNCDLLERIFQLFAAIGGKGLPTGLGISAALSDFMMRDFDTHLSHNEAVYFYARYVDDILIVTNGSEKPSRFMSPLLRCLPKGLSLNDDKVKIADAPLKSSPALPTVRPLKIDFLGYAFSVDSPPQSKTFRPVKVDISAKKIAKIKTRISRSFLAFAKKQDFPLLEARIKFLTTNFDVKDPNTRARKLAGIYESFPHIRCSPPEALEDLNRFLAASVLGNTGRPPSHPTRHLTNRQKRTLMGHSFIKGHEKRIFSHFSRQRLSEIKECWKHGS